MTATRIEFYAVARALRFPHSVSYHGFRALASHERGLNVLLIQSGIGPAMARKGVQQLLDGASWDVMISSGFAGDLKSNPIGSVLIGHEVFLRPPTTSEVSDPPRSIVCDPGWVKTALGINLGQESVLRTGKFVSVDRVLTLSVDKHQLYADTGAVGVDMESAVIGEVAHEHGFPFLIVRAISDVANEDLPVDFNLFFTPSGWMSGIRHIVTTPKSWKGFLDLYRHSKQASRHLTRFFEEFFSTVSKGTSPSVLGGEA